MGRHNHIYLYLIQIICFRDDVAKTHIRLVKWLCTSGNQQWNDLRTLKAAPKDLYALVYDTHQDPSIFSAIQYSAVALILYRWFNAPEDRCRIERKQQGAQAMDGTDKACYSCFVMAKSYGECND